MVGVFSKVLDSFKNLQAVTQRAERPSNAARWKITKEVKKLSSEVEVPGSQAGPLLQTITYVACVLGSVLGPMSTIKVIPPETSANVTAIAVVGELLMMALIAICVTIPQRKRH